MNIMEENSEIPTKEEIESTLKRKKIIVKEAEPEQKKKTPLKKYLIIALISIIVLVIIYFFYVSIFNSKENAITGKAISLEGISSKLTGFFVQEDPLPKGERFGILIKEKEIDLNAEEEIQENSLVADQISRCTKEKMEVKENAENKIRTLCDNEKENLYEEITYWKNKYQACQEAHP
jgi:hypothetical protein